MASGFKGLITVHSLVHVFYKLPGFIKLRHKRLMNDGDIVYQVGDNVLPTNDQCHISKICIFKRSKIKVTRHYSS